jgi:hypothetical protein
MQHLGADASSCKKGQFLLLCHPLPDFLEDVCRDHALIPALRSDCQQIHTHPSERNASWMSARLS